MKKSIAAFVCGIIFAIGLGLSGMTQPEKVIGFLDIFGNWDPSLMFVMMGAIGVHFFAYKIILKRTQPLLDTQWHIPDKKQITPALAIGAFIFGIGWGLGGFCPGPAFTSLVTLDGRVLTFVISMIVGMLVFNLLNRKLHFRR